MPIENETILVVRATGRFGSLVVPVLTSRRLRIQVLARQDARVRAARVAGVRRFVFSSAMRPLDDPQAKRDVENALYESGLQYTVLRPAHFMQNLLALWPAIRQSGLPAEPYGASVRLTRVDDRDVAEVAAIALSSDCLAHASLALCAGGAYNRHEIVVLMSEFLERTVRAGAHAATRFGARLDGLS